MPRPDDGTRLEDAVRILGELIAFPTVSSDSNVDVIDHIAGQLCAVGARVEILSSPDGTKANLWATLGPEGPGGLVLSGHTDVVPVTDQAWTSDPFVMTERDGALFGRGSCDMKGFIACCLAALPDLVRAARTRPIHFAFTHDEEVGCIGGRALAAELKARGIRPALCIIGEPTRMQVIEGNKGCCEYSVHFTGIEGHSSNPDLGVNAVEYAARYIARLMELRGALIARAPAAGQFDPPWTTLNVGALHGGVAHNVIANHAQLDWEMRPVNRADHDFMQGEITALTRDLHAQMRAGLGSSEGTAEIGIRTEIIGDVIGLEPMKDNAARDLVFQLTGANAAGCVPFNTEAGLFQDLGIDVVICGPGDIAQAHKPDEYVTRDQLSQCLALFARLADHPL